MGVQELMLLVLVLHSLCSPASFVPDGNNYVSESTHKKMEVNQIDKNNDVIDVDRVMLNQSKYTTAIAGGKHGGRSVRNGRNGGENGGQSTSSPQNGGNGQIPVYAAGASGQRRNEKGGAAICSNKKGFAELMATTLVSLLLHIPIP